MILSDAEKHLLMQISKQYSDFEVLLKRLRQSELEVLALTSPDSFATQKGRVAMLTDLLKHTVVTQTP